ncbi:MAG: hypothetical protein AB1894_07245 [Chloroflexota bacterium]
MIQVYINYPVPHVTVHGDPGCGSIQAQHKPGQRYCRINVATIATELQNFRDKQYVFAANPERNDMWLEVDFHNREFEMAVVEYVCHLLGTHYGPFVGVKPKMYC